MDEYGERGIIVTDLGNATKLKKLLIDEYKLDVSIEKIIPFAKDNYTNWFLFKSGRYNYKDKYIKI